VESVKQKNDPPISPFQSCYELLERATIGIVFIADDGRVTYSNHRANRILGVEAMGLLDYNVNELFGEQSWKTILHNRQLIIDSRCDEDSPTSFEQEATFLVNSPTGRQFEIAVYPFQLSPENDCCIYIQDITLRSRIERELQERSAFFHNLIDSSPDGVIAADMKGNIILFNRVAQTMLNYSEPEAITNLHVTRLYPEGIARDLMAKMRSSEFGGKGRLLRHNLVSLDNLGNEIPVSLSGGIIYDEKERETASFGIFTDLREMKKMEADVRQAHEMVMQSEKMAGLGRLAAGVAHEINNPLSGILMYTHFLLENVGEDHHCADDIKLIIHETERCKRIVKDLLEFSHQTTYERKPVPINELIQKSLSILTKQVMFQNVELIMKLQEDLPLVNGDSSRLMQVFLNIAVNAAESMENGGKFTITTQYRPGKDFIELYFRDQGPGIPDNVLPNIFDPFFTTKGPGKGTGLGLSVSYAIIKEHQGRLYADSEENEGSTFIIKLPLVGPQLSEAN
jgi:two-component system, NtrC family, sensor kinase